MIGSLIDMVHQEMENGVYNFCKDGKCTECGECCSALLPLSDKEIRRIKKYIKKNGINGHRHNAVSTAKVDLVCPFLDTTKNNHKCDIYEVRPKICKTFICCTPPSKIKENKEMFWKTRMPINMWELVKD